MKRVCGKSGCPELIDALPNAYYCERHTEEHFAKHDSLESEYEDEVEGALDGFLYDASDARFPGASESDSNWYRYTAEQVRLHVPAIQAAAHSGEIWTAIRHALWVGRMSAQHNSAPREAATEAYRKRLRSLEPVIDRGEKSIAWQTAGTDENRKLPKDLAPLILELGELKKTEPNLSTEQRYERVASKYRGASGEPAKGESLKKAIQRQKKKSK